MQIKIFKNLKHFTLTSSLKKSDIELLKKYRPSALKKRDDDGNDVFAISYVEGRPCLAANGVTFGSADVDEGCAMIVGTIPETLPEGTTARDYVADITGSVISYIKEFETSIPEAVNAIKAEREALIGSITEA